MYGFLSGISDTDIISYCPKCGENVSEFYADGTACCKLCDIRFGVIELEESEE